MSNRLNWEVKLLSTTTIQVPNRRGIYVIGHKQCVLGLTLENVYVYVGKSENLQRRSNEHFHLTEKNPGLADYLRKNRGSVYFWFTTDVPDDDLDGLERTLIQQLKPIYNNIEYKTLEDHND